MDEFFLGPEFDVRPTHRFFFAILPDDGAIDRLTELMKRLRNDKIMLGRPVNADRLHITLHHLGDFGNQVPPSLELNASKAAATIKMQPFDVTFDRIVGTGKQFLLRPSDELAELGEFRENLSTALIKAGLRAMVKKTFNPHITLSYDPSDAPERRVEPITWTVKQFVLIESLLGKTQHNKLGSWPLGN